MGRYATEWLAITLVLTHCGPAPLVLMEDTSGRAGAVAGLAAIDNERGFSVVSTSLQSTDDGGISWTEITALDDILASSLVVQDRSLWVGGSRIEEDGSQTAVLLRSEDGGATWQTRSLGSGRVIDFDFCDSRTGWVIDRAWIANTRDGGESWTLAHQRRDLDLTRVVCDGSDVWVLGFDGTAQHSGNMGTTWDNVVISDTPLADGYFRDERGWIVGFGGLYATRDGGRSWQLSSLPSKSRLFRIEMRGTQGWIAGEGGLLLRSDDGGNRWRQVESRTDIGLTSIHILSTGSVWVGGDHATILELRP